MKDIFIKYLIVFVILQLISLFYKVDTFSCLLGAGPVLLCFLIDLNLK